MRKGLLSTISDMRGDRRATVLVWTALCAFPMFGMMGLAFDYASAISTKSKLDMAADAAAISAITKAKTVIAGGGATTAAIAAGQVQGLAAFKANAGALSFGQSAPAPTISIVPSTDGRTLTATIAYAIDNPNQFGKFFKLSTTRVAGTSASSTVVTPYYQFIFVVDVSGSMAIGGTDQDIANLYNDNDILAAGDGVHRCSFACHDPDLNRTKGDPRGVASRKHYKLKIDFVKDAIQSFISNLSKQAPSIPGVFSVGIDTFATTSQIVQAPTLNFSQATSSAASIDIENMMPLTFPPNYVTQGYTNTTSGLQFALANINNIGNGTSPDKQVTYFIFLSDGVEDVYHDNNYDPGVMYNRITDVSYISACNQIKNQGATLISIAAPYPLVTLKQDPDGQYQTLVQPFQPPAPTKPFSMTTAMQNCATGGATGKWALVATDGPAINTAVQTALNNILQGLTRLTQ